LIKNIELGQTKLSDLHEVFKFNTPSELENKKARLFPSGNTDSEVPTTSIFLASLGAVKEYRELLLTTIGVNKIKTRNVNLHVYTELQSESKDDRPDGMIVITSGKHNPIIEWAAFIEVKVSTNDITDEQVGRYIEFGKEIGINNIITISNEMVTHPTNSPVKTKKKSVNLYHWSWSYLKVMASKLVNGNLIKDEDHIYILQELRRYMDNHKNLKSYNNMGKDWKEAVTRLHGYDAGQKIDTDTLTTISSSYKQAEKNVSLQLMDKSSHQIEIVSKDDRGPIIEDMLKSSKVISTPFTINRDKKCQFFVDADFTRQEIRACTYITIEKGKAQAQTTALLKLLDSEGVGGSDDITIKAIYIRNKSIDRIVTLRQLLDERGSGDFYSILDKSFGDEVKRFEIKTSDLLNRDFQSAKNFPLKMEAAALKFLEQVMYNIIT